MPRMKSSANRLADRCADITQSEIRAMTTACRQVNGINMAQGVCDIGVPDVVTQGVVDAMAAGYNTYTHCSGLPELRGALGRKLKDYNRIACNPDHDIIVSAGSTGAFYAACMALLNPGDEVILLEPYYGYHINMIHSVGAVARCVTTQPPDWSFTAEAVEAAVTPRTRAIIICTPSNPSGKVYSRQEIELLGAIATKHDLLILTDEIYEYFLYDGREHVSPATVPGLADRTVTISGPSKTFSITGWRIGYSVCAPDMAEAIAHMNDLFYICAPAPLQMGVAAGTEKLGSEFYEGLRAEFRVKRETFCRALESAGLTPYWPQGAYYVLADISRVPGRNSKERAMKLLETTGVATVPGSAFHQGAAGEALTRFCFAKTDADIAQACERLQRCRTLF